MIFYHLHLNLYHKSLISNLTIIMISFYILNLSYSRSIYTLANYALFIVEFNLFNFKYHLPYQYIHFIFDDFIKTVN